MKRHCRTFSTEFKHDAAALVVDHGYAVTEACRSLDVGKTALRRWVDQLLAERRGVTPQRQAMTAKQLRIQALEAQVHRLEEEKRILKMAIALLMPYDWNRTN